MSAVDLDGLEQRGGELQLCRLLQTMRVEAVPPSFVAPARNTDAYVTDFFVEMNPASAMPGIYGVLPYAASLSNTAFCPPLALYWVAIRELLN